MAKAVTDTPDGRPVELEASEVQTVHIRMLPNGRMDRKNAAKYLGRKPKTLAMWALAGKGPPVHKHMGRCFYYRDELDADLRGEAV